MSSNFMTFKAIPIFLFISFCFWFKIAVGLALVSRYPCICFKIFKKKNGYKLEKSSQFMNHRHRVHVIYGWVFFIHSKTVQVLFCGGWDDPIFSSPCQRQCELLPSIGVRRLVSIIFSHFNLLLWNLSAKWTETW